MAQQRPPEDEVDGSPEPHWLEMARRGQESSAPDASGWSRADIARRRAELSANRSKALRVAEEPEAQRPKPAPVPKDLVAKGRGRKLWRACVGAYQFRPDELELLAEVCRSLDFIDRVRAESQAGPLLVDGRVNPLLVELRQVQQEVRRAMGQLNLPDLVDDAEVKSVRSVRARKAARARWSAGGI